MISSSETGGKIVKVSIDLDEYLRLKSLEKLIKDILKTNEIRDGHRDREE